MVTAKRKTVINVDSNSKKVRWDSNSEEGVKLKRLLEERLITPSMMPKVIKELYPEFKKFPDSTFRSAVNRMKGLVGFNVRTDGDEGNSCYCKIALQKITAA
jgi:hypothetical protein